MPMPFIIAESGNANVMEPEIEPQAACVDEKENLDELVGIRRIVMKRDYIGIVRKYNV